jgi:hypothetical protein
MTTQTQARSFEQVFLTACFLIALCLPVGAMFLGIKSTPLGENRVLAPLPQLSMNPYQISNLPRAFGHYFNDRFAFRESLIRWQATIRLNWLRTASSPQVTLGKDGWFFYTGDGLLEYYAHSKPFTEPEMARWLTLFEARSDWLKQRGISFVIAIVPESHTIYPEFMPDDILRIGTQSRLDQLKNYCETHSDIRILDLRPALLAEKSRQRIYHRTNTHWNGPGAFIGYREIINRLREEIPALNPRPENFFRTVVKYQPTSDLIGLLGTNRIPDEENILLVPGEPPKARSEGREVTLRLADDEKYLVTENRDTPQLPRVVMFRDSFASSLIPLLAEHFSRGVFLWKREMDKEVIEAERPKVVIFESSERLLMEEPPKQ